jgi:hypothetical protein
MTELPNLPPRPRMTRPGPAGGVEAVIAEGRRRKMRLLASAGATALAVVVAIAVLLPGGATERLTVAEDPSPSPPSSPARTPSSSAALTGSAAPAPSPSPSPSPSPPTPTEPAEPADQTASGPSSGPTAGTTPLPPGAPTDGNGTAGPAAAPTATPSTSTRPTRAVRTPYQEDTNENATGGYGCTTAGDGQGGDVCHYSEPMASEIQVGRGQTAAATMGMCKSPNAGADHVFVYAGGQEKDVVVYEDDGGEAGREIYRFSSTVTYTQGAHERRLRKGGCIEWTGRWDLTTTEGAAVPPGRYLMSLTLRADHEYDDDERRVPARETPRTSTYSVVVGG